MSHDKKKTKDVNDEVEELLRAAEDAALLKISINSHTVHASPSDLHPDLDQRFRNLKSGSKSKPKKKCVTRRTPAPQSAEVNKEVEEDDLLARFAALKATLPKPSPSVSSSSVGAETSNASVEDMLAGGSIGGKANIDDEEDDEDEVEKVIRWAMDAARLDPSPSSDDEEIEDDTKDDDSDENKSSDEDLESPKKNPKGKRK